MWTNLMCFIKIATQNLSLGSRNLYFSTWVMNFAPRRTFCGRAESQDVAIRPKVDFGSRGYWCQPNSEDITKFLRKFWKCHITKLFWIINPLFPFCLTAPASISELNLLLLVNLMHQKCCPTSAYRINFLKRKYRATLWPEIGGIKSIERLH